MSVIENDVNYALESLNATQPVLTHNYYIDYLKAFSAYMIKKLRGNPSAFNEIQKVTFNYGSKTIYQHKLYGNEQFEYPNMMINLNDIRVDNSLGVSEFSRINLGVIPTPKSTALVCENFDTKEKIYIETKRYIMNFDIVINCETSSDLLNIYHLITSLTPMEFTFLEYSFMFFVDITKITNDLNWNDDDDIFNYFIESANNSHGLNKNESINRKYTSIIDRPEIEFVGVTKNEDKENMKYSVNINVLTTAHIPYLILSNKSKHVDNIVIDINFNEENYSSQNHPILLDIDLNVFNDFNITKSINIEKWEISNEKIFIYLSSKLSEKDQEKKCFIRFIENFLDTDTPRYDYLNEKIKYDYKDNESILIIDIVSEKDKNFLNFLENFKNNSMNYNKLFLIK